MKRYDGGLQKPEFDKYVKKLCEERGISAESVINDSAIERTYGHQLFNGTRKPSRDKVIQIAIGFGLDYEETQQLLQIADKSQLYPRIKRDATIIFAINNQLPIQKTQELLASYGLTVLGGSSQYEGLS